MSDTMKGALQDVAGKVQDAVGGASGDTSMQMEGKVRQGAGKLQRNYGEALDQFRESAVENPALTLAIVAGVAFFAGVLWGRRD